MLTMTWMESIQTQKKKIKIDQTQKKMKHQRKRRKKSRESEKMLDLLVSTTCIYRMTQMQIVPCSNGIILPLWTSGRTHSFGSISATCQSLTVFTTRVWSHSYTLQISLNRQVLDGIVAEKMSPTSKIVTLLDIRKSTLTLTGWLMELYLWARTITKHYIHLASITASNLTMISCFLLTFSPTHTLTWWIICAQSKRMKKMLTRCVWITFAMLLVGPRSTASPSRTTSTRATWRTSRRSLSFSASSTKELL